jgi:protein-S-isoprenylcysteine O-methyltransferase Ste14
MLFYRTPRIKEPKISNKETLKSMRQATHTLIRVAGFALTIALWLWMLRQSFSPLTNLFCIIGTVLAIVPTVWIGRRLLDIKPTRGRTEWVTTVVHGIVVLLFGVAIIKAIQTSSSWQGLIIPIPRSLGIILVYITGTIMLLTVVNLAIQGLGAPFAIALSRRLAKNWLYARTRNPMVLATLACLVTVGLWLQSALFVVWVLLVVTPVEIIVLKVYEERELEIRFGEAYREYKAKTSFLWPRKSKT